MKKHLCFFAFLLFLVSNANGQSDSLEAELFVEKAKLCLKQKKVDSAMYYHAQATQFFKGKNQLVPWLKSYWAISFVWAQSLKQPFKAIEIVEASLHEKWRDPISRVEWEQYAANYLAAGFFTRVNLADYAGAKSYYEKALDIFVVKLNERSDRIARYLYHNLANIYSRHGDYERAINLLKRSLDYNKLYPAAKIIDHGDLAIALIETNRYSEALEVVRQALSLENVKSEVKIGLYINEADALFRLGEPEKAIQSLDKIPELVSKMVADKGSLDEKVYLMQYHGMKAKILADLNESEQAGDNYRSSIKMGTEHWETDKRREIGKVYGQLGELEMKQNRPASALSNFHRALQCVLRNFTTLDSFQLPEPTSFRSENTILEALEGKARAFLALQQPEKALQCYELIPHVEAKLRATHAYESSSLRALDESRQRFDDAMAIAWQLYEQSNRDRHYAERAFLLSEQARGVLLLQSLARAQTDYQLPPDIRKKENDLRVKSGWYEREIEGEKNKGTTAADASRLAQIEQELFNLKQEQERFKAQLRDSFPDYARLLEETNLRTTKDIPALLRPNQAFVNYYLTNDAAYIFFLDGQGALRWRKAGLAEDFRDSTIQRFLDYLANGEGMGDATSLAEDRWLKKTAAELYVLLIGPELSSARTSLDALVIVPDGVLAFLPFDLLLRDSSQAEWSELPLLLRDFSISYATSATLLGMQQANTRKHEGLPNRLPFGGFAPVYSRIARDPQTNQRLYDIKGMQEQVKTIVEMLGGQPFYGDSASEVEFYRTAPLCRVLLLAMHGFANENAPVLSRLLFGNPAPKSDPDNVLYTSELQVTNLPADLAVLNACYTGFGKIHKGEGVYSVSRALTAAGVSATLMSIWQLAGTSSPLLVTTFFQHLQHGNAKDVALQKAKITLLNEHKKLSHPSYWAGFLATGDMSAMKF